MILQQISQMLDKHLGVIVQTTLSIAADLSSSVNSFSIKPENVHTDANAVRQSVFDENHGRQSTERGTCSSYHHVVMGIDTCPSTGAQLRDFGVIQMT